MSSIFCQQSQFGTLETGQVVTCYSLRNTSGMTVNLLNYAAILDTIQVPDSRGEMQEITLKGNLKTDHPSLGSTIVHLPRRYGIDFNNQVQTLWEAESISKDNAASIQLSLNGVVDLKYSFSKLDYQFIVEYTLTESDELIIRSQIQSSLPFPIFATHHPLWNLAGKTQKSISDHILQVWAPHYSIIDQTGFANSTCLDIHEAPSFNFEQPQRIGARHTQLSKESNYDICFRLTKPQASTTSLPLDPLAARVKEPISGRTLEVYTSQPGLRFYLPSNEEHNLKGFCLAPMQLLSATETSSSTNLIQQETAYKLVW